jgi:hypothetical protein
VFAFDGEPTQKDIIERLKKKLGEEFDYISDYQTDANYDIDFRLPEND